MNKDSTSELLGNGEQAISSFEYETVDVRDEIIQKLNFSYSPCGSLCDATLAALFVFK
jgi:hypothetical protein